MHAFILLHTTSEIFNDDSRKHKRSEALTNYKKGDNVCVIMYVLMCMYSGALDTSQNQQCDQYKRFSHFAVIACMRSRKQCVKLRVSKINKDESSHNPEIIQPIEDVPSFLFFSLCVNYAYSLGAKTKQNQSLVCIKCVRRGFLRFLCIVVLKHSLQKG